MKRIYRVCAISSVLSLLINISGWLSETAAQNVDFPDTNLAAVVRTELGISATDPITQTALAELPILNANGARITDLTGLEHATGLTGLALHDNQISNLSALSGLDDLTVLSLSNNRISDLSPLSGLTNLTVLYLSENQISDLSPLSGLTNLIVLYLDNNQISDLSKLSGLTNLQTLLLWQNRISDLSPLSGLTSLIWLYLHNNQISDLSKLSGLTNLYLLSLDSNQISDLGPLSELTSLQWLLLNNNQISDLRPLSGLTNLNGLYLDNNQISDLAPLSGLTNLNRLSICYNEISDISPLSALTKLITFRIDQVFNENNPGVVDGTISAYEYKFCPIQVSPEVVLTPTFVIPGGVVPTPTFVIPGVGINIPSGKKRSTLPPSPISQDRIIFNEIRNAEDNINDWIELKNISDEPVSLKDWEISIVTPSDIRQVNKAEDAGKDEDIVAFSDYTLPAGGILLIVNTDPSETQLAFGQDITDPTSDLDVPPQYLVAPEMRLPDTPYLLILRSATDKNGKPEAFEDLAGNYFRGSTYYNTQVWPLRYTEKPFVGTEALLTQGKAWRRIAVKTRGYTQTAWTSSGHQSGIGYKPDAPVEKSLGTPGYPNDTVADTGLVGRITISEVMFATNGGLFSQSQWIELYNNTPHAAMPLNLKGWKLAIEARDSNARHRYSVFALEALEIATNQAVLLVTRDRRNAGNMPEDQLYDLYEHHGDVRKLGLHENKVLGWHGFGLRLYSPDGTLVDVAGNLDGERGRDTPKWELPSGRTEDGVRTSLIRGYEEQVALDGTAAASWVRAADMLLPINTYYGHKTDISTPGHRSGGPAPVTLSHFRAVRTDTGVIVEWKTASELNNAGFNILRSQKRKGSYVKVNPTLILGAGTTAERHTYTWTDTTAKPNVAYYYRLEDVSLGGTCQRSVTVRMRGHLSANGKLLQKWGNLKRQQ